MIWLRDYAIGVGMERGERREQFNDRKVKISCDGIDGKEENELDSIFDFVSTKCWAVFDVPQVHHASIYDLQVELFWFHRKVIRLSVVYNKIINKYIRFFNVQTDQRNYMKESYSLEVS